MEYIKTLDTYIDNILDNDIVYSFFVILLIIVIVFPTLSEINGVYLNKLLPSIFNLSTHLTIVLYILCVLYVLNKDVRLGVILTIMFLINYEKQHIKIINKEILQILVSNISLEQRLEILKNNRKN